MAEEETKSDLEKLRDTAVIEGYSKESPRFDKRVRQLQVTKCREMRGQNTCTECPVYDYCELIKQVMRERKGY